MPNAHRVNRVQCALSLTKAGPCDVSSAEPCQGSTDVCFVKWSCCRQLPKAYRPHRASSMQATHSSFVAHTPDCCPCRPPRQPFTSAFPAPRQKRSIQRHRHHELYCQHRADSAATDHSQHHQQPMYHISAEVPRPGAPPAQPGPPAVLPYMAAAAGVALTFYALKRVFDTPSRAYKENVGDEYDSWTEDGVLEYYWGEHIHLGYYTGKQTFTLHCSSWYLEPVLLSSLWCPLHIYLACDSSVLYISTCYTST